MKKEYIKPVVKKEEVHLGSYVRYDKFNPLPDVPTSMTPEELDKNWSRLLDKIPIHGGAKLQQLYDSDLKYLTWKNLGYTEDLHIRNLKKYLTERSNLHDQIRAQVLLKFLENKLTISEMALILYYNGDTVIKKGNASLYNKRDKYCHYENRVGVSDKELPFQIKRLEKILKSQLLKESAKQTVIDELNILKARY